MVQLGCEWKSVLRSHGHRELTAVTNFAAKTTIEEVELGGILVAHQVPGQTLQTKDLSPGESCQIDEDRHCEIRDD